MNMINPSLWSSNLYVVVGLVVVGSLLGISLLNWIFDYFLDS